MTPPEAPQGRPYTPEEMLHANYADAYTSAENLFRALQETRIENKEVTVFSFNEQLAKVQLPYTLPRVTFGMPSEVTVTYMQENGFRPDLHIGVTYNNFTAFFNREGDQPVDAPFAFRAKKHAETSATPYAPVAADEIGRMLASLAFTEEFMRTFGTAKLRAFDLQHPQVVEAIKSGLFDRSTKTERMSEFEVDLYDKDGYWLSASKNTLTQPVSYQLAVHRYRGDMSHSQMVRSSLEVTLHDTDPDASIPLVYTEREVLCSSEKQSSNQYSRERNAVLTSDVLSFMIAACKIGTKTLKTAMPDVIGYEHYAQEQRRKDDPLQ